jgi:hypothetical protein
LQIKPNHSIFGFFQNIFQKNEFNFLKNKLSFFKKFKPKFNLKNFQIDKKEQDFNQILIKNKFFSKNFFQKIFLIENYKFNSNFFLPPLFNFINHDLGYNQHDKHFSVFKFNNFSIINYTGKKLLKHVIIKLQNNNVPITYKYIFFNLISFLEFFLKKKIYFFSKSQLILEPAIQSSINYIFNKSRFAQLKIGRGFFLNEMIYMLYCGFFFKDANFILDWFIRTMERVIYINHKKFLNFFKYLIVNFSNFFLEKNHVKGFFFDIRGKVGVSGNAKKRHFSFSDGKFSKTTKFSKFDYAYNIVRTFTGALGVTIIIYF